MRKNYFDANESQCINPKEGLSFDKMFFEAFKLCRLAFIFNFIFKPEDLL